MPRLTFAAAILVATLPTGAFALDCDEFERRVQASDTQDLLRPFDGEPSPNLPGLLNVESLPGITLGLSCPEGRFEGLGATLSDSSRAGLTRWSIFVVSAIKAIAPESQARGMGEVAAELQQKANDDAKRREIREGLRIGSATETVGDWEVRFETGLGQIRFQIEER